VVYGQRSYSVTGLADYHSWYPTYLTVPSPESVCKYIPSVLSIKAVAASTASAVAVVLVLVWLFCRRKKTPSYSVVVTSECDRGVKMMETAQESA
jgi:hypothetical protein